ncbi:putative Peroxidase 48 [Trifolium pratense]|uniref:putative Peroxidase 48 n=1 Tax=Trifolium pratense TaxID=57577 RepID=UPI001E698221|nr:putative Peroxidase 48 [Trifolium pratense]
MAAPLILPKLTLLILVFCILISFDQHKHNTNNNNNNNKTFNFINTIPFPIHSFSGGPVSLSVTTNKNHYSDSSSSDSNSQSLLEYDFYRNSCPNAERIVRSTLHRVYKTNHTLIPALIRLAFHDCFIQGCDASILLEDDDYIDSEKDSPPNGSLKGFDVIETIKSKLEVACPGVVSCADILVLAARDSVALAGGPFYPLYTGRRDGSNSFADIATDELPSPYADLSQIISSFKLRGFDEREMVTLLGAHNIGVIHCKFFENHLYNLSGTNKPDPSMNTEFLNVLRSRCNETDALSISASGYTSHASSSSLAEEQQKITMDSRKSLSGFGMLYYRSLLQGKGILYADQQLMEGEKTKYWVQEYASNPTLFRQDFALAMMKLSDLRVLTMPMGQIRRTCSKVA